ncbi:MAG: GNAT family N-acetyltransferase [Pseudomonadota bacterium]
MLETLQQVMDQIFAYRDTIAILALIVTIIVFIVQQRQGNRIEKQENYLTLELASNDLFKFEGEHAKAIGPFQENTLPDAAHIEAHSGLADAFFFMTLNLFEASVRFRKNLTIEKTVFGSWVVWYYDTLCSAYFRSQWPRLRENYTVELKEIFDEPSAQFDSAMAEHTRKIAFFDHVARILNCPIIRDWLDDTDLQPDTAEATSTSTSISPATSETTVTSSDSDIPDGIAWLPITPALAQTLAAFFVTNIQDQTNYISHSEYFEGMSPDGVMWAADLQARIAKGMLEPRTDLPLEALTISSDGVLHAVALVDWDHNGHERYGVLEDMAVAKTARRQGLGQRLIDETLNRAVERGAQRLVLESGARNDGAHGLFEANGFEILSKVFIKHLKQ